MVPDVEPVVVKPPISVSFPFPALVPAPIQIPCFLFLLLCLFFLFEDRKAQKAYANLLYASYKSFIWHWENFMHSWRHIHLSVRGNFIGFINICFIYPLYDVHGHENLPLSFLIFLLAQFDHLLIYWVCQVALLIK